MWNADFFKTSFYGQMDFIVVPYSVTISGLPRNITFNFQGIVKVMCMRNYVQWLCNNLCTYVFNNINIFQLMFIYAVPTEKVV
jgi:hypothetical protein